jgi:acyl-coenzyme A thioesterase PaaI-like protein
MVDVPESPPPATAPTAPPLPPLPTDAHRAWIRDDPPEGSQRALKHQLVRTTKRLIEAVALLDIHETDAARLRALVEQADAVAEQAETLPTHRGRGSLALARTEDAALMERSGISGRSNPLAAPLHLAIDPENRERTRGWAVWGDAYEGPPGCLHGGFVAAAFDDLLGFAQIASGLAGYTGTLTVRMRRPTPLNALIEYEAWVDHVHGKKIFVRGTSSVDGIALAEAEILFIQPRQRGQPGSWAAQRGSRS